MPTCDFEFQSSAKEKARRCSTWLGGTCCEFAERGSSPFFFLDHLSLRPVLHFATSSRHVKHSQLTMRTSTTAVLATSFAAVASAQSLGGSLGSISSNCQQAALTLLGSDFATCSNLQGLLGIATSTSGSLVQPGQSTLSLLLSLPRLVCDRRLTLYTISSYSTFSLVIESFVSTHYYVSLPPFDFGPNPFLLVVSRATLIPPLLTNTTDYSTSIHLSFGSLSFSQHLARRTLRPRKLFNFSYPKRYFSCRSRLLIRYLKWKCVDRKLHESFRS